MPTSFVHKESVPGLKRNSQLSFDRHLTNSRGALILPPSCQAHALDKSVVWFRHWVLAIFVTPSDPQSSIIHAFLKTAVTCNYETKGCLSSLPKRREGYSSPQHTLLLGISDNVAEFKNRLGHLYRHVTESGSKLGQNRGINVCCGEEQRSCHQLLKNP